MIGFLYGTTRYPATPEGRCRYSCGSGACSLRECMGIEPTEDFLQAPRWF